MKIAYILYRGFTALDLVGPHAAAERLRRARRAPSARRRMERAAGEPTHRG